MSKSIWGRSTEEFAEGSTFIGTISACYEQESDYDRPFIRVEFDVHDREVRGDTGRYHEGFGESDNINSKCGQFMKALEDAGVPIKKFKGPKDLVGICGEWEDTPLDFISLDNDGNEITKTQKVKLLKQLTDKKGNPVKGAKKGKKKKESKSNDYDFEPLIEKLKELDEDDEPVGMSKKQVKKWARKNDIPSTELEKFMEDLEDKLKTHPDDDELFYLE
jgi:hypothetical protein